MYSFSRPGNDNRANANAASAESATTTTVAMTATTTLLNSSRQYVSASGSRCTCGGTSRIGRATGSVADLARVAEATDAAYTMGTMMASATQTQEQHPG